MHKKEIQRLGISVPSDVKEGLNRHRAEGKKINVSGICTKALRRHLKMLEQMKAIDILFEDDELEGAQQRLQEELEEEGMDIIDTAHDAAKNWVLRVASPALLRQLRDGANSMSPITLVDHLLGEEDEVWLEGYRSEFGWWLDYSDPTFCDAFVKRALHIIPLVYPA